MYFTRDPVVETLITAREGYRLLLRSTAHPEHEEFLVDIVEVVNLGSACFFRSLEKPKAFLVPMTDYALLEVKEQRVALKAPVVAPQQKNTNKAAQKDNHRTDSPTSTQKNNTKKQKKQRKIGTEAESAPPIRETVEEPILEKPLLIPPPTLLISDTISRYKEMTAIEELSLESLPMHAEEPKEDVESSQDGAY